MTQIPMFGTPDSILATIDHDVHRRRRNAYSNYFSKQSIRKYSNVIQTSVDKLCVRMREHQWDCKPVNLMHAYSALAGDVVTGYCFPESYGLLDKSDFAPEYYDLWQSVVRNSHMLKQFPWLFPLMLSLPSWAAESILPDLAVISRWQRQWLKQIEEARLNTEASKDETARPGIFRLLLDSDLPPVDKTVSRLVQDAQNVLGAASETTSRTLAVATYYILSDEEVLRTLIQELKTAVPDPNTTPALVELEQLTYLTAIIYETLRISHGVTHRLQRVAPDQALRYHDWSIPAGTPVGMSSINVHTNSDIFPAPHIFKPERWLPLETEGQRLNKYLVAFSKGSRQCLGMNLAYAELYMTLAAVFRHFGGQMKIVDTVKERDVDVVRDVFTAAPSSESKGIFVMVREGDGRGSKTK